MSLHRFVFVTFNIRNKKTHQDVDAIAHHLTKIFASGKQNVILLVQNPTFLLNNRQNFTCSYESVHQTLGDNTKGSASGIHNDLLF